METIIEKMSDFVTRLNFAMIPSDVVEAVKYSVLDILGDAIMGSTAMESKIVIEFATEIDKNPEVTIWGAGKKVSSYWGILVNGNSSEGYDFTAAGKQLIAIPAIVAAEREGNINGKTLITAIVGAAETMGSLGPGFDKANGAYPRFFETALYTPWGSVGAVGKILNLSKDQLNSAYGLAGGTLAAGTFGFFTECIRVKAFLIGKSLANGFVACCLARKGLPGPKKEVENPFSGLLKSYSGPGYDPSRIVIELPPKTWRTKNQIYKPYPACRYVDAYLDALFEIFKQRKIDLEDVDEIIAYGTKKYREHVIEPREPRDAPKTVMAAQFSLPYVLAIAIKEKQFGLDQLKAEKFRDPEILNTTKKLKFQVDPEIEKRFKYDMGGVFDIPARLVIRTKDGKEYSAEVDRPKGMPTSPMTKDELIAKFKNQASRVLPMGKVEKILSTIKALEKLDDTRELIELLH